MAKAIKKEPPKPLEAHYEKGVAVVRIPASATPEQRNKALNDMRALAKKYSNNYSWY